MKKWMILCLTVLMLVSLAACGAEVDTGAWETQIKDLQEQVTKLEGEKQSLQQQLAQLGNASDTYTVTAIHATVNGDTSATFTKEAKFTAIATLEEGMIVDHWLINGVKQEESKTDTWIFTATEDTTVEAVIRPELKVTTIQAEMRFLDEKGKADGDPFEEFVFEEAYENPVTKEQMEGGKITVQVKAVIPSGYMVDYWLINGVKYKYTNTVNQFVVTDLDETTEYEVVLKEIPPTYYKLTCTYCTYKGKKEANVKEGTKVTIEGTPGYVYEVYVNGVQVASYVKEYTFTMKEDTHVAFYAIIN